MALNEQMQQMVQQDIQDAETRPKEEILKEQMEGLKTAGRTARDIAVESIPGVSEALAEKRVDEALQRGDTTSAMIEGAAGLMGAVPIVGDILSRPIRAAAKKLRKQDSDVATKMLSDVESIETWKKQNPNPKPQKQNPNIEKAANDLLEGKITGKQYRSVVKENMPIQKIEEVPEVPSFTEIVGALDKDKSAKGIIGLNKKIKDGTRVSSRLDIPAYERFDKWVVSVHDAFDKKGRESLSGDIMGYGKTAVLKNVEFKGSPTGAASISARKTDKGTIARIFGDYYNAEPENVEEYARQVIKDKDWTQVGYNPFRHGFFYDKNTGMPVKSAEEVIQVGPLVLAKNAQKIKISEAKQVGPKGGLKIRTGKPIEGLQNLKETKTVFNEGGVVPMKRMATQMELFEPVERGFDEGGLMDEGGTVDPVSGNDVPPGSTQEEVRDDIPAQLSEGEFVFPADVVRYIGLENLMRMRQEAKQGLAQMEAMGQMGNGDEAVMPDDLPFDMYDLDIDDEGEYNSETRNYQVGGYVPPSVPQQPYNQPTQVDPRTGTYTLPGTGIAGYQVPSGAPTGYTPYGGAQPYFQPVQFTGPQFQTALQTTNLPTFAETVGQRAGQYDELRTYINDAGQTLQIPFKDGRPIYPIPEGYRPIGDQPAPEEEQVTVAPTLGETAVRDDGGRDDNGERSPGGSTDVTGIGYSRSGLIDSLSETISKYGAGFGVLSEAFSGINPISIASQIMGKPADTKVSSNTSAAFGGVLDAFRGMQGTPAELARQAIAVNKGVNQGFRGYTDTRSLSNMEEVDQAVIAGYADVVMPDIMKSFVNADGSAKSASQTNSELRDALSDLGLSKSDIDAIANAGGNYNQNQKLSRALGNIAVKDIQSTTNKDLIDKVSKAVVAASAKAKAAEEAGNVARDAGLVGVDLSSDAGQKAADAAKAAADAAFAEEQKAFDDAMKAAGKPDVSDATPAPSSRDEGGSGGRGGSEAGDPSGGAGEGSGTDCLTEKMKVKLNGVVDFVTNIKVGDMIDGCVVKEVLHKHMRSGYFVINNELEITNDHPVLANGAWTKPEELYIGDYINDVKVESIKYIDRMTPTVSIVIDGDSFDVYTKGNTYTVHGRYREVRQQAA